MRSDVLRCTRKKEAETAARAPRRVDWEGRSGQSALQKSAGLTLATKENCPQMRVQVSSPSPKEETMRGRPLLY